MERKEFLKRAGVGSVVLAGFPAFAEVARADNGHDGRTRFYFQALSGQAATLGGGEAIVMSGCGPFGKSRAGGGGEFVHFDGRTIPSSKFIATGSWEAGRVLSFQEIGTWGVAVAGILQMAIRLLPCDRPAVDAMLKIVCNIGPAGLITSPFQQEGFTLTIPGVTPFSPFTPNIGLTLFTRPCEEEDEDHDDD